MLILKRYEGDEINIGENIVIKVVRLAGGHVQIGIEAPDDVRVMRAEIDDQKPPAIEKK